MIDFYPRMEYNSPVSNGRRSGRPGEELRMSEEFGSDFITVTDDEGNAFELELLGTLEWNGESYKAFLPADMDEDDPDYGIIILKCVMENGEELLGSVDDDEELQGAYDRFMEILFEDEEEDEGDCGCGHLHQ